MVRWSSCYLRPDQFLDHLTVIKRTNNKTRFTNLAIDVVVHGDVGVRDVDLDVEVGDVLDPRVVAIPHQRLHRHNRVHYQLKFVPK